MNELERRAVLALWSCEGVGPQAFERLMRLVPVARWLSTPWRELVGLLDVSASTREHLLADRTLEARLVDLEKRLAETRHRVCFKGDPQYPAALVAVRSAPPLLFYAGPGAVDQMRGRVAIVGTRKTDSDWLAWTRRFGTTCAQQSLVVVSGAAEGIDTNAHQGALDGRGLTWAFVASGLDQIDPTPKEIVTALYRRGGTVFSEYPPGVRANKASFVQRNRLISGSAQVVVCVRGAADSGARHTAAAAVTQGRALLAVPGDPLRPKGGELSRQLLREGARPCFDVSDVLAAMGLIEMPLPEIVVPEKGEVSDEARAVFDALPPGLFDMEKAIAAAPAYSSGAVTAAMMELEISGWLVSRSGRRYEKRE
ncbi:MAG: DNA-processing protein DprA [Archangiaceae bacterium]|nr:DNA-processing protein DprA [Archangiaceae bacterium]